MKKPFFFLLILILSLSLMACGDNSADEPQNEEELPEECAHVLTYVAPKEATCTEDGILEHYRCSICGTSYTDATATVACLSTKIGASHGNKVRRGDISPTLDEDGYSGDLYCERCNELVTPGTVLPKLQCEHVMQKTAAKAKSCETDGNFEYYFCSECDRIFSDAEGTSRITIEETVIPASHEFVGAECSECGYYYTAGLVFEPNGKETEYTLVGVGSATDLHIIVPYVYNGKPVTAIADDAFANLRNHNSVFIPESIVKFEATAFTDSVGITVYCEAAERPSGWDARWNYSYDKAMPVVWNANSNDIADDGYIYATVDGLKYAIKDGSAAVAKQAESITLALIPDTIEYKGEEIPVTEISFSAFANCLGITSVTIGKNVTDIQSSAFRKCENLESIYLKSEKLKDMSNGKTEFEYAGYNTDGITLYVENTVKRLPECLFSDGYGDHNLAKIVKVKFSDDTVCESIGEKAFYEISTLTEIIVPDSVTSIGAYAFYKNTALEYITIGKSVITIGSSAFDDCPKVKRISFNAAAMPDLEKNLAFFDGTGHESGGIDVIIGSDVTTLPANLFYCSVNVSTITFEEGSACERIGSFFIRESKSISEVYIPESVTKIEIGAFHSCYNLVIFCEADSALADWHSKWVLNETPVVYNYPENDMATDGYIYYTENGARYALKDNVATIYYQRSNAKTINIPKSITYKDNEYKVSDIVDQAFTGLKFLTEISVSPDNQYFSSIDGVLYTGDGKVLIAYPVASKNAHFSIPDGVTKINAYAFYGASYLARLDIPKSVECIEEYAITSYATLNLTIYCEAEAQPVGWEEFWNTQNIPIVWSSKTETVATDGKEYLVYNGVRYVVKDDHLSLTSQPLAIKELVICSEITYNGRVYAVTEVEENALRENRAIISVVIPNSITHLGTDSFLGCSNLTDVYFTGTEEEWNSLMENYADNILFYLDISFNYSAE